jgi:membrane-associated phospholipid phosphatase
VDAPGNALPSLHVATALFTALWIERLLHEIGTPAALRRLNWLWLTLIVYATLATKQHLLLDVLAGGALGAAFARASLRWFPAAH